MSDFFHKVLVATKLKKSEQQLIEDEILEYEKKIRSFNDQLNKHIKDLGIIDDTIREIKIKYDNAKGGIKNVYESQLRSLLKDCNNLKEARALIIRNIDKTNLLLHNKKLELDNLLNPTNVDDIEDSITAKEELLSDIKEEDRSIQDLEKTSYQEDSHSELSIDELLAANENVTLDDELNQMLSEIDNEDKSSKTTEEA